MADLMAPRYEVIAEDTSEKFVIGSIIIYDDKFNIFWVGGNAFTKERLDKYPHLFRKLEWWEKRQESEMPEYVKAKSGVFKVSGWGANNSQVHLKDHQSYDMTKFFLPATKSEYDQYIKSKP